MTAVYPLVNDEKREKLLFSQKPEALKSRKGACLDPKERNQISSFGPASPFLLGKTTAVLSSLLRDCHPREIEIRQDSQGERRRWLPYSFGFGG